LGNVVSHKGELERMANYTAQLGAVSADAVKSITLISKNGVTVTGNWTSQFGSTEWTFTPSEPLAADTEYTLTIPATLTGDNQIAMGKSYTASFITAKETRKDVQIVNSTKGVYYSFTVNDSMSDSKNIILRFAVENNANNLVKIYPVTSFNAENPDDSVVSYTAIASCPIFGAGLYECDVASYIKSLIDEEKFDEYNLEICKKLIANFEKEGVPFE